MYHCLQKMPTSMPLSLKLQASFNASDGEPIFSYKTERKKDIPITTLTQIVKKKMKALKKLLVSTPLNQPHLYRPFQVLKMIFIILFQILNSISKKNLSKVSYKKTLTK